MRMTEIKIIKGDILTVEFGVIVHGVNCFGVFNAGIAKQIRQKYPEVCSDYLRIYKDYGGYRYKGDRNLLGTIQICSVSNDLYFVNAFTQLNYGNDGKKYVSYDAIDNAFAAIARAIDTDSNIHFPKIGCGLAGGEWSVVQSIIEHRLKDFPNKFLWIKE
jgi:O-acetyl-ADP-ribose deacetylase (regulator of RNase III)